jgi:hypothetical protein
MNAKHFRDRHGGEAFLSDGPKPERVKLIGGAGLPPRPSAIKSRSSSEVNSSLSADLAVSNDALWAVSVLETVSDRAL